MLNKLRIGKGERQEGRKEGRNGGRKEGRKEGKLRMKEGRKKDTLGKTQMNSSIHISMGASGHARIMSRNFLLRTGI